MDIPKEHCFLVINNPHVGDNPDIYEIIQHVKKETMEKDCSEEISHPNKDVEPTVFLNERKNDIEVVKKCTDSSQEGDRIYNIFDKRDPMMAKEADKFFLSLLAFEIAVDVIHTFAINQIPKMV